MDAQDLPASLGHAETLGAGAFGAVYRAVDAQGRAVAVKVLHPSQAAHPEAAWLFGAEYRRLKRVAHPLFPRAYEEGRTPAGLPYYSMELVVGTPPEDLPWPAARVRAVLAGLARGLAYLHGVGLVHGDVKPENLRLAPDGEPRLLDMGLAAPVGQRRTAIAGSLPYMAPEVLRKAAVDPQADVYALAALACELWTGRPPFEGSAAELIRAHLHVPPPTLPAEDLDLAALLTAMLAKEPARRPALAAVLAALGEALPEGAAAGGGLSGGAWIPRPEVLAAWAEASAVLVVEGAAGLGKSRTLDELRLAAQQEGLAWVGASCLGAADAPAAPLRAVVRQALALLTPSPIVAAWLAGRVPEELVDLEPPARQVAFQAEIAAALAKVAGLVIGLDDWHLADAGSRTMFEALRQAPLPGLRWVLAVLPGEAGDAGPGTSGQRRVALEPLTEAEAEALITARLAAPPPAGLVARLVPLAAGSPQLLDLLLEHLVATGALARAPEGWRFGAAAGQDAALPDTLAGVWAARAATLPADARDLARVAALAAEVGALPVPLLGRVAGLAGAALETAAEALGTAGLASLAEGRLRLTAPGLARTLRHEADPAGATALAIGLVTGTGRAGTPPRPAGSEGPGGGADLGALPLDTLRQAAWLALEGNDEVLAAQLVAAAADRGLALWGPAEALRLLDAAAARLADPPPREALALRFGRAEAARYADRTEGAAADYELALGLAERLADAAMGARAGIGLAKCRQILGAYDVALVEVERARAKATAAREPALEARAWLAEARLRLFKGAADRALACCQQASERAEAAGARALRGQALDLRGVLWVQAHPEHAAEGLAWIREAIAIARELRDRRGEGLALDNLGNAHLALGELAEAADAFDAYAALCRASGLATDALGADLNRAKAAAERGDTALAIPLAAEVDARAGNLGRRFPQAAAKLVRGQALWRGGRGAEARAQLDEALALGEALGNRYLLEHVRLYRLEALAALGDLPAARLEAAAVEASSAESRARLACLGGQLALLAGDAAGALAVAQAWLGAVNRWAAHAARRLGAEAALALGDPFQARVWADEALAIAATWRAPWHEDADRELLARALRALGQADEALAAVHGIGEANPEARAARDAWLRGARPTSVAGRAADGGTFLAIAPAAFRAAIDDLALARDEAEIGQAALRGAIALAQAERGYLLVYEGGELRRAVTAGLDYAREVEAGFSHSIAEQALLASEPVYVVDASADPTWRQAASVMALGLHTVVCLPLAVPERTLGVLYMDRQALEPVLGPADLDFLQAFATAAASAVQRVRAEAAQRREAERQARNAALAGAMLAGGDRRAAFLCAAIALLEAEQGAWLAASLQPLLALDGLGRPIAFRPGAVSAGVLGWVAERDEPLGILDVTEDETFQARESVQALGARTVWCLPAGGGEVLYFDAGRVDARDPEALLPEVQALLAFARPFLP
ncbi:MAG: protein kinase [Cyanobacteria bacterium RYN_339]|nr:protein kinase [Cyanobacteria bacterium RYN_339]